MVYFCTAAVAYQYFLGLIPSKSIIGKYQGMTGKTAHAYQYHAYQYYRFCFQLCTVLYEANVADFINNNQLVR